MKKTLLAASIAALSAGFIAAPALADVAGEVGINLTQPTDSDKDTALTLEFDINYTHESGAYAGFWFETYDFLEGDDFSEESNFEVYAGYANDLTADLGYDLGLIYGQPIDNDDEDYVEIYLGAGYSFNADLATSAYIFHDIDSDADSTRLELFAEYTGMELLDFYAELVTNLQDSDEMTLELGLGKEIISQHYVTASFIADLDDSDENAILFTYFYSF